MSPNKIQHYSQMIRVAEKVVLPGSEYDDNTEADELQICGESLDGIGNSKVLLCAHWFIQIENSN